MTKSEHYRQINQNFKDGLKDEAKKHPIATALLAISMAGFGSAALVQNTPASESRILDHSHEPADADCITSTGTAIPEGTTVGDDTCVDAYTIGEMRVSSFIYQGQKICVEWEGGESNLRTFGNFCAGSLATPDTSE